MDWQLPDRKIIVEDVATEADGQTAYVRRMVFAENSNLIQSEARLMEAASLNTGTQVQQPGNRKGHKAKLPKTALLPPLKLDNSKLAMEYHKHIMAGILACEAPLNASPCMRGPQATQALLCMC